MSTYRGVGTSILSWFRNRRLLPSEKEVVKEDTSSYGPIPFPLTAAKKTGIYQKTIDEQTRDTPPRREDDSILSGGILPVIVAMELVEEIESSPSYEAPAESTPSDTGSSFDSGSTFEGGGGESGGGGASDSW